MNAVSHPLRPWMLIGLGVVLLATAQVALAHRRLDTVGHINLLQHDIRQAGDDISRLQIELSMLTRPERLRHIALDKLGMRPPTAAQVVNP